MSYILEAIKKADQKRKLGSVPDVLSEHGSTFADDKRVRWPYWAAAVLFINAGVLGWWLFPSDREEIPPETVTMENVVSEEIKQLAEEKKAKTKTEQPDLPKETKQALEKTAEEKQAGPSEEVDRILPSTEKNITAIVEPETQKVLSAEPGGETLPVKQETARAEKNVATGLPKASSPLPSVPLTKELSSVKTEQGQIQDIVLSAPEKGKKESIEAEKVSAPAEPAPEIKVQENITSPDAEAPAPEVAEIDGPVESLDSTEKEPIIVGSIENQDAVEKVSEDDLVEEYKDEQEKEDEKKALEKIPFYFQLPEAAQKTLPEFHISFHMYAKRPSARIVSMNGKILREGMVLEGKVKLEKITTSGVVLVADSWRFKVDVE